MELLRIVIRVTILRRIPKMMMMMITVGWPHAGWGPALNLVPTFLS